jgi:hypothetical protein
LFIQVHFVGEPGVDAGGLTREFFHVIFRTLTADEPSVRARQVFHGRRPGHLLPVVDIDLVEWSVYWFVGVVTVQAARAGHLGLPGLCTGVRHFLAGGARISSIGALINEYVSVDDVADDELREVLLKVDRQ